MIQSRLSITVFALLVCLGCSQQPPKEEAFRAQEAVEPKNDPEERKDPEKPKVKRVATPITLSPAAVFGAAELINAPFEDFPAPMYAGTKSILPDSVSEYDLSWPKKLEGTWIGYWRAKNSFILKNPIKMDQATYRVYLRFNPDKTWDALWLSKLEPEQPSYASASGKYSFEFPRLVLQVTAMFVNYEFSSNEGDLADLKFVCDACDWQEGNDLLIPIKLDPVQGLILFDQGSVEDGYTERVYLLKQEVTHAK
ncbi:MAG: hypothetical protein JKY15_08920 [Deltaproteobacteria bacterium]|nr:hypothetical protein [Deltaproteobacteria bacterium]